ncbi:ArnT family glycosyltransferase [Lacisediminimonas profundi]|uniref:ArnT family glycosyltransferase n=1 Tax=Lacisediminimonas profundi TaxID=2603856 RepID=UPI0019D53BDC|nr:glycosyltransferase family 39 protein [Lacisediminimonas profundi]
MLAAIAMMARFHVGFQGGDDKSYLTGAIGWLQGFPYVGDNHWALRHTITIPTALSVKLFGLNEVSVGLSNSIYFLLFTGLNAWMVSKHFGGRCAAIASLLILTLPGFIVLSTYLDIDIPELLFVSLSFWLFRWALDHPAASSAWIASGALLGIAFITRETSAAMVLFLGILFLFHPMAPRSRYLLQAGSFATVIAIDWGYLTAMTGNPFYRYRIDFNHDHVDRFAQVARTVERGGLIDSEGNLSINVFLDPVLNLLVTQKYGVVFWLLVPAMLAVWKGRRSMQQRTLLLLGGLGLVWFLFIALNPRLYLVPRYFIVPAWIASIAVAWWLVDLFGRSRRRLAGVTLLAMLVGVNLLALSVENINPRFTERQMVAWVAAHPGERVYSDLETIGKVRHLLRFSGIPMDRVAAGRPVDKAIFFYNPDRIETCKLNPRCRESLDQYRPRPDWKVEQVITPAPLPIGRLVRVAGLDAMLPGDISRRLLQPGGSVVVYRTGGT